MVCLVCTDLAACRKRRECRDQRGQLVLAKSRGLGRALLLSDPGVQRLFEPNFGLHLNHGADDAPQPNGAPRE